MHCVSSLFRENSQLKSDKLWEQVIHIFDLAQKYLNCVPKYIIFSTKIYYSVHKYVIQYMNIYYWVSKYISDQALKYIRLPTKIFHIVFQNILDRVLKYFRKTWGLRKHFLIMIKLINHFQIKKFLVLIPFTQLCTPFK